jgi:hypothetical protein
MKLVVPPARGAEGVCSELRIAKGIAKPDSGRHKRDSTSTLILFPDQSPNPLGAGTFGRGKRWMPLIVATEKVARGKKLGAVAAITGHCQRSRRKNPFADQPDISITRGGSLESSLERKSLSCRRSARMLPGKFWIALSGSGEKTIVASESHSWSPICC